MTTTPPVRPAAGWWRNICSLSRLPPGAGTAAPPPGHSRRYRHIPAAAAAPAAAAQRPPFVGAGFCSDCAVLCGGALAAAAHHPGPEPAVHRRRSGNHPNRGWPPAAAAEPPGQGSDDYAIYSADTDGETEIYLGFGHRTRALDWLYWVQGQLARVQAEKLLGLGLSGFGLPAGAHAGRLGH